MISGNDNISPSDGLIEIRRKSIEAFEFIIKQFTVQTVILQNKLAGDQVYNDNYAGMFLDKNGHLNFCTVGINKLNVGKYEAQVVHRKVKYSLNHLNYIVSIILPVMNDYGICSLGVDIKENLVKVDLREDVNEGCIESLITFLNGRGICKEDAVKIQKVNGKNILF